MNASHRRAATFDVQHGAVLVAACLALAAAAAVAQEAVESAAHPTDPAAGIGKLGAFGFRERREARKALSRALHAIDAEVTQNLEQTPAADTPAETGSGSNTPARAAQFYSELESALAAATDPEVVFGLTAVLEEGRFSSAFFKLAAADQALALLPFETHVQPDGLAVERSTYGANGNGITDLGNIRIVRRGLAVSGRSTSSHLLIRGGGGSSGSSGSGERRFSYNTQNGVTACEWGESFRFSIAGGVLCIGPHRVPFDSTSKVLFVSPENKVETVVRLRATKAE